MRTSFVGSLAKLPGLLVTGSLATIGSFGLGFAVMTDCTTDFSCASSGCGPCSATSALLISGWVVQGLLFAVAVALWLPVVLRRLGRRSAVALAVLVPVVSVVAFAGVSWAVDRSYCRPDQAALESYCDVG